MLRIGIMGSSSIVEKAIDALRKISDKYEIVALYSYREESGKKLIEKLELEVTHYTNKGDFFKDTSFDIVYIATPNSHHYVDAKMALQSDKHVILEKPFVADIRDYTDLIKIAYNNDLFIFEAIILFYNPGIAALKEKLATIGQIRYCNFHYHKYSSRYDEYKEGNVTNVFSKEFFGGTFNDLGVYPLHVAVALFGTPTKYNFSGINLSNGVNGLFNLCATYSDKFLCNISASKMSNYNAPSIICGEKGSIIIDDLGNFKEFKLVENDGTTEVIYREREDNDLLYEFLFFHYIITNNELEMYDEALNQTRIITRIIEEVNKRY